MTIKSGGALPHVTAMAPYTLAGLDVPAGQRLISLAQNESLRGPTPHVADAVANRLNEMSLYPDPDWTALREALAERHGINAAQILCGAGSMELIQCIAHAWLDSSSTVVTSQYAYAFINSVAKFTNAAITHVTELNYTVCVDALADAVNEKTSLVFIANPGNPTGTRIDRNKIRKLRERLPEHVLLVIDEAYAEFSDALDSPLFDLTDCTQTVVLRTFSKAYGLAGMRVGWGVFAPSVAEQVRKLLNPNNISVLSQLAAVACVEDHRYMLDTCRQTALLREELAAAVGSAGLNLPASHTNFVLLPFHSSESATAVDSRLRRQGMVMRNMAGYGLPHCQRLTIVDEPDMTQVQSTLLKAIEEASAT